MRYHLPACAFIVGLFGCSSSTEDPKTSTGGSGGGVSSGGVSNGGSTNTTQGGSTSGGQQPGNGGRASTSGGASTGGASTGGASSGGASTGGSTTTTGGTPSETCGVSCSNAPAGACTAPTVRISEVDVGMTVAYSNQEVPLKVIALGAMPGGGSRLAWLSNDNAVHVATLDCEDKLTGTPFSLPAWDLQDIAADANGGAVLVTRNAAGGGTNNCGDESQLCGLSGPSPSCYEMHTVRFDCAGKEQWATQLGTSSASAPPYTAGKGSNHFIWSNYQHHGRLAYDGTNYAAYFCEAITIANGSCVDIHEGDRMQVVGPTGSLLSGHDSFPGGCSHSGFTRIVWDQSTGHFIMTCKTDNNNRLAMPNPYRTIYPLNLDGSYVGDVIVAKGGGYWITVSNNGAVHMLHFSTGASDQDINLASANYPHLAAYGADYMIAAWASGTSAGANMTAQVRNRQSGAEVGATFPIAVPGNPYLSFKSYPDGSIAYAAQGTSNTKIRIARVMPCSG